MNATDTRKMLTIQPGFRSNFAGFGHRDELNISLVYSVLKKYSNRMAQQSPHSLFWYIYTYKIVNTILHSYQTYHIDTLAAAVSKLHDHNVIRLFSYSLALLIEMCPLIFSRTTSNKQVKIHNGYKILMSC